jgi:hypothetical protein
MYFVPRDYQEADAESNRCILLAACFSIPGNTPAAPPISKLA